MTGKKTGVQPLIKREVAITSASIMLAVLYQSLWYFVPSLLALPLRPGSTLTLAFLLGTAAILIPILSAYYIVRYDIASDETFGTSHH